MLKAPGCHHAGHLFAVNMLADPAAHAAACLASEPVSMSIDPRILTDTIAVCMSASAHVRLMNDARWPWLILIPRQSDISELHQLSRSQRDQFMSDVNQVSRLMQESTACRSINIAMLGNVVSQLHCHVIARNEGDGNWPGPVWGHGTAVAYDGNEPLPLLEAVRESFSSIPQQ